MKPTRYRYEDSFCEESTDESVVSLLDMLAITSAGFEGDPIVDEACSVPL